MCDVDWAAVAAWVQAIGSIGAIIAAIFIFKKQHAQSIALVERERARLESERSLERRNTRGLVEAEVAVLGSSLAAVVKAAAENRKNPDGSISIPEGGIPLSTAVSRCAEAGVTAIGTLAGLEFPLRLTPDGALACYKLQRLANDLKNLSSALDGKQAPAISEWAIEKLSAYNSALDHLAPSEPRPPAGI